MSSAFKIAVLGPIPRDHITTYQNEVVEKYGCVIYPVVALSTLMSEGSRIVPVTHVRKVDQAPIQQILSSFRYVDPGHVTATADQGDVIRLKYVDQVVDTTGCGDSFAGGLAFGYLKTRDYVKACYYGNAMGAQRCTGTELAIYKDIEETEQIIATAYGHP